MACRDLGTLPIDPSVAEFFASWANGLNDLGSVVGGSWYDAQYNHAFLWTRSGGIQDLGVPPDFWEAPTRTLLTYSGRSLVQHSKVRVGILARPTLFCGRERLVCNSSGVCLAGNIAAQALLTILDKL